MNEFFVQTVKGGWEEVDQYIYDNYKFVAADDTENSPRRYSDNRFSVINGNIDLSKVTGLNKAGMGTICRMAGITIPQQTTGFCTKPTDMLVVRKGSGTAYYKDGKRFVLAQPKKKPAPDLEEKAAA